MKHKNPLVAAVLNVIIPGLGCFYVGSWFYAIIFFVWVPLAYFASFMVAEFVTFWIQDVNIKNIFTTIVVILLCFRILYEQLSMPYEMALKLNQESKKVNDS